MGGCLRSPSTLKNACPQRAIAKFPEDSGSPLLCNASLLTFRVIISNLKLRKCKDKGAYGANIRLGDYEKIDICTKAQEQGVIDWDNQYRFSIQATQRKMKEQYLQFDFFNAQLQKAGSLSIDLYSLASGPANQDFPIEIGNQLSPRISFRIQLSQEQAQMVPTDKEFPGDIFAFGLISALGNKTEESKLSYKYLISLDQLQSQQSSQKKNARKMLRKQTLSQFPVVPKLGPMKKSISFDASVDEEKVQKQIEDNAPTKKIKWTYSTGGQLPFIQAIIPVSCLHAINFNIVFYSFNLKTKTKSSQSFISLNKLFNFETKEVKDQTTNTTFLQQQINVNLKSWSNGAQVGNAKFLLFFRIQKHLKQMQMCVRTQSGIIESLQPENTFNCRIPEHILEIERISKKIQNQFIKLPSLKSRQQKKDWIQQLNQKLVKQRQLLIKNENEFDYNSKQLLLQVQRRLFELGRRVIQLLDEGIQQIEQNCWSILTKLIDRKELEFTKMSFENQQIEICLASEQTQFLIRKKEFSKQYYKLMAQLLQRTIQAQEFYVSKAQRQFAQIFLPYAYFRMTLFRNHFLENVARDSDQQQFQTQKALFESKYAPSLTQSRFTVQLDWESKFYKVLQTDQDIVKLQKKISQMLGTSNWQERLHKRGKSFYTFVRSWIIYIQKQCQMQDINWNYIPGYSKIIIAFISQIKKQSIQDYSDQAKQAWITITNNSELFNCLLAILYRKTNINSSQQLTSALQLISLSLRLLVLKNKTLSDIFNYQLFFKGIKLVIQGQNAAGIERALCLLYENFHLFSTSFKNDLISYLLRDIFYRLFLHWSFRVRIMFHQLIIAKVQINHLTKDGKQDQKINQTYKNQHLQQLNMLTETLKRFHNQKILKSIPNSTKELYQTLREKIKFKVKQKSLNITHNQMALFSKGQQAYIQQALKQYSQIQQMLQKLKSNNQLNDMPAIRVKQAIDEREIRP